MRKLKKYLSRIRLVYRRSSNLTKCVVIATLLLCTAVLVSLRASLLQTEKRTAALRTEAASLEQEKNALKKDIEDMGSVESVKKIAYAFLGLVDPDAVIYEPEQEPAQD